jgi:hypothetical protein
MKVPARHKGDFGVDYYCVSGRVAYQCYAVQEPCDVDDRATKQKAKITKDLKKFCTRAELASLFVGNKVERWILVVPIHDSAQVNLHLSAKTAQVRALGLAYVATDFEVLFTTLSVLILPPWNCGPSTAARYHCPLNQPPPHRLTAGHGRPTPW